jgi:hypothetical protein
MPAFLNWNSFRTAQSGLFVWEAFVTSSAKGNSHKKDAEIAVRKFVSSLSDIDAANAIPISGEVYSLAGAALLRSGWSNDVNLLQSPSVVVKSPEKAESR